MSQGNCTSLPPLKGERVGGGCPFLPGNQLNPVMPPPFPKAYRAPDTVLPSNQSLGSCSNNPTIQQSNNPILRHSNTPFHLWICPSTNSITLGASAASLASWVATTSVVRFSV